MRAAWVYFGTVVVDFDENEKNADGVCQFDH
jgi:hypothetical protein